MTVPASRPRAAGGSSSRRRAAELAAAIGAMDESVIILGRRGQVRLMNPAARATFAPATPSSLTQIRAWFADPDGTILPLVERTQTTPVELRPADGTDRWYELRSFPIEVESSDGGPAGNILVIRDITALRARQVAGEAFMGILSHELRTPITTIYGNSRLLRRAPDRLTEAERAEVLADIEAEADRLHRLVDDLLVLARFREERVTVGDEPLLIHRLLPPIVRAEESSWPGVRFELALARDLPPTRGDATYVEQAVRNLVGNAAKYGGSGTTVRVVAEEAEAGVAIRVLDEGPGFPADESRELFELFYRSPSTADRASGGGIGLFVCRRLVEAMGGRVWARPREEGGAEFGFWLPNYESEPEP